MDDVTFDTPESSIVLVTDNQFDHCICGMRPTDADNPDNGWVTLIPLAYIMSDAPSSTVAEIVAKSGRECTVVPTSLDILSQFEEGIRQIALLKDGDLCKLSAEDGQMMEEAEWLEMSDKGTVPVKVNVHHE